jgi:hypothetical protein
MQATAYTLQSLYEKPCFNQLPFDQRELLSQSFSLLEDIVSDNKVFYDYSFVVMPASKAYEGFVKDLVYRLGLISEKRYRGKSFRVGKALNPQLAQSNPDQFEALYDDLERIYQSKELPEMLWQAWKECRNQVFHYFVDREKVINLNQAKQKLQQIMTAIEKAQLMCSLEAQPTGLVG